MALDLTPEEIKLADASITRLEQRSRSWAIARWLMICGSVMVWVLGLLYMRLYVRFYNETERHLETATSLSSEALVHQTRKAIGNLQVAVHSQIMAMALGLMGAYFAVSALAQWRKGPRDALLAKILRAKLEEELGEDAVEHAR